MGYASAQKRAAQKRAAQKRAAQKRAAQFAEAIAQAQVLAG